MRANVCSASSCGVARSRGMKDDVYDDRDRANVLEDLRDAVRGAPPGRGADRALDDGEALAHLVARLGDPDWRVRKATVQRIATRPDPTRPRSG